MTTTDYDSWNDVGYLRYASVAGTFAWCKTMIDAGVPKDIVLQYYVVSNQLWYVLLQNYSWLIGKTPSNTRAELGELELGDLIMAFDKLFDDAPVEEEDNG